MPLALIGQLKITINYSQSCTGCKMLKFCIRKPDDEKLSFAYCKIFDSLVKLFRGKKPDHIQRPVICFRTFNKLADKQPKEK